MYLSLQAGLDYLLREYTSKEAPLTELNVCSHSRVLDMDMCTNLIPHSLL